MSQNERIAVIYRSKSGFTKNYATWIAKELNCTLLERNKVIHKDLQNYDTIIYGGGLYAGGITGINLIIKNFEQLKNKKIIIFAVGATPNRAETTQELLLHNIPENLRNHIEFYYLRGGFDYDRLSMIDKVLMQLLKVKLKRIKDKSADEKGMLASYDHPLDFTNIKNIQPIINSVRFGG